MTYRWDLDWACRLAFLQVRSIIIQVYNSKINVFYLIAGAVVFVVLFLKKKKKQKKKKEEEERKAEQAKRESTAGLPRVQSQVRYNSFNIIRRKRT